MAAAQRAGVDPSQLQGMAGGGGGGGAPQGAPMPQGMPQGASQGGMGAPQASGGDMAGQLMGLIQKAAGTPQGQSMMQMAIHSMMGQGAARTPTVDYDGQPVRPDGSGVPTDQEVGNVRKNFTDGNVEGFDKAYGDGATSFYDKHKAGPNDPATYDDDNDDEQGENESEADYRGRMDDKNNEPSTEQELEMARRGMSQAKPGETPSEDEIALINKDPTDANLEDFDDKYGDGAARRYTRGKTGPNDEALDDDDYEDMQDEEEAASDDDSPAGREKLRRLRAR